MARLGALAAVAAVALLLGGCTAEPHDDAPSAVASSAPPSEQPPAAPAPLAEGATWIHEGRYIAAIVADTVPLSGPAKDVEAVGQAITFVVDKPTTGDEPLIFTPVLVKVPESVDRTKPATVSVRGREDSLTVEPVDEVNLDGDESPSATWLPNGSIALVTPGSSCAPRLVSFEESGRDAADVTLDSSADMCFSVLMMHLTLLPPSSLGAGATLTVVGTESGMLTVAVAGKRP